MIITIYTTQKFNIATEKWWLEDDPFLLCFGHFSGENSLLNFRAGMLSNTKKVRIPCQTKPGKDRWRSTLRGLLRARHFTSNGSLTMPWKLPLFSYGRDGHQPHNRGCIGPHSKDSPLKVGWVYPRYKEFRPWHIWKIVWVQPSAVEIDVNMWFIKYIIFRG